MNQLFEQISKGNSVVTAAEMVPLLQKTGLPNDKLSVIWQRSEQQRGYLDLKSFVLCMKMVALAQQGLEFTEQNLQKDLVPKLDLQPKLQPQHTGVQTPIQPQMTGQQIELQKEDRERFTGFFESLGPSNGVVTGDVARDLFLKSQLPVEQLSAIWRLADTKGTGNLNLSQFLIAMTLITKLKTGQLLSVPAVLPPSLLQQVGLTVPSTPSKADPSEQQRRQYQLYFADLDKSKKGFLTGAESYDFFVRSGLPPAELAQIWDTVDVQKTGAINVEGFITAMHMIRQKMDGKPMSQTPIPQTPIDMDLLGPVLDTPKQDVKNVVPLPTSPSKSTTDLKSIPTGLGSTASISPLPVHLTGSLASNPALSTTPGLPTTSSLPSSGLPSVGLPFTPNTGTGLTSSLSTTGLPSLIPSLGSSTMLSGISAVEIKNIAQRQSEVNARQDEVLKLEQELSKLAPSQEELQKKREQVEEEFKQVTEKKNQLTIDLVQKRAQYESDVQTLQDLQISLARELQTVTVLKQELGQYEQALKAVQNEKQAALDKQQETQDEMNKMKKQIQELTDETNKMRDTLKEVQIDLTKQQQFADVNRKLLDSTQDQYKQVKSDLEDEQMRLQLEIKRNQQLKQQAQVQEEINKREKQKLMQAEELKRRELQKSQELLFQESQPVAAEIKALVTETVADPQKEVKEQAKPIVVEAVTVPARTDSLPAQPAAKDNVAPKQPEFSWDADFSQLSVQPEPASAKSAPIGSPSSLLDDLPSEKAGSLPRNFTAPIETLQDVDVSTELSKTFASKEFKPAKDASSVKSSSSAKITKPKAFSPDAFTFDATFKPSPFSQAFSDFPEIPNAPAVGKQDLDQAFEQAVNALELNGFVTERAINYLLESTATQ
ncbi:hypothetical protein EDD86DRAFT_247132 [Gorgonomyces haynaldii]|nr:hypothetical protein EDD86DRAFT_247132 [Gorgonomyces haynaldii]